MTNIERELKKLGVTYDGYSVLQNKDGITVARISDGEKSYILKHFEKEEHRREIKNYSILMSLNIPTADVLAANKSSLLLRDIAESDTFRLGTKEDMSDVNVARRIARWYKKLHQCGYKYVAGCKEALFDEADYFTEENIDFIKRKTNTQNAAAWALLKQNFFAIDAVLSKAKRTLTYNDFYYTNMAVAKDGSARSCSTTTSSAKDTPTPTSEMYCRRCQTKHSLPFLMNTVHLTRLKKYWTTL